MPYHNFTIDYIDKSKLKDALKELLGAAKFGEPTTAHGVYQVWVPNPGLTTAQYEWIKAQARRHYESQD